MLATTEQEAIASKSTNARRFFIGEQKWVINEIKKLMEIGI